MSSNGIKLKPVDTKGGIITLDVGRHILGRGSLLGCSEKNVSRNHAVIDIQEDGTVYLESTHMNPCFLQKSGHTKTTPLTKFVAQELFVGDRFSLLPNNYTYEVLSNSCKNAELLENLQQVDEKSDASKSTGIITSKSKGIDVSKSEEIVPNKSEELVASKSEEIVASKSKEFVAIKSKEIVSPKKNESLSLEAGASLKNDSFKLEAEASLLPIPSGSKTINVASQPRKRVLPPWIKELVAQAEEDIENASGEAEDELPKRKNTPKKDKVSKKKETNPRQRGSNASKETKPVQKVSNISKESGVGQQKITRKPCPFGRNCYRKNPVHFQEESHPDDDDYYISPSNSDTEAEIANDNRPECEYGLNCYRKNPEHRKQYKHTRETRPPRAAAKRAKVKNKVLQDDEDDDDSFIDDDDDSDVYNPASDKDTDEDIGSLLAEANEFKHNKKMLKPA